MNGDGYDDYMIGAPGYDVPLHDEGAAFLYLGRPDLASPTHTPTATVTRPTPTPTRTVPVTGAATFQYGVDEYFGSHDVEINSWFPDANQDWSWASDYYGTIQIRANDQIAALIRFDISRLPTNAVVTQATLTIYATSRYGSQPVNVGAYQVKRRWVAREATWNKATSDVPWEVPGCNGVPSDRVEEAEAVVSLFGTEETYEFDVTEMAGYWVKHPGLNRGLALKTMASTGGVWVVANEHGGADLHPKLTVNYYIPSADPTATGTASPTSTEAAVPSPTMTATPTATGTAKPEALGLWLPLITK